jgi:Domain of unknown function (DUF5658)
MTTIALRNETTRLLRSRYTFIVLQVLDLATTLLAFHMGAFEMNPLVAQFASFLGPVGGVLCSKAIACLIVLRVRRLMWVANVLYTGVVGWNCVILLALSHAHR